MHAINVPNFNAPGSLTPSLVRAIEALMEISLGVEKAEQANLTPHCNVDMMAAWENLSLTVQRVDITNAGRQREFFGTAAGLFAQSCKVENFDHVIVRNDLFERIIRRRSTYAKRACCSMKAAMPSRSSSRNCGKAVSTRASLATATIWLSCGNSSGSPTTAR